MAGITWFRRNLRITDNAAFQLRFTMAGVFFFDQQWTGDWLGIARCGEHRRNFLQKSLHDLEENLRALDVPFHSITAEPEVELPRLCRQLNVDEVHTQALPAYAERQQATRVRQALMAIGVRLIEHDDYTLFPTTLVAEAHPTSFTSFSKFRKKLTPYLDQIIVAENSPSLHLQSLTNQQAAVINEYQDITPPDPRAVMNFIGGETFAQQHLVQYCESALFHYKETRNELIGQDYSSKLSPWLNLGCISPRQVLAAVKQAERIGGANASTEWLIVELMWRDFFQFCALERGHELFGGSANRLVEPNSSLSLEKDKDFTRWQHGATGHPFLDANMRELAATGFMSNRGRQNVASALIHDLGCDWRLGAVWFEQQLIDYDPASNYGNWQYIAGIHANSRGGSWFNLDKQAALYDSEQQYQALWLTKS
ncbi:DASH family cryptochrome [Aliidiomarina haloalkalitolerans]|uniref:Cryptochrome DASH n=1 Tax=Aliidiomarina haloalkalitolerans TaxID=859059 RepID=A0A432VYR9_9GAMM|nr:DASH family cryptochrome [Aliidiomarina haloalkalitolerans]RUO21803.1 hypothetical protein CWE06_02845 [Aliidiomarina haloalkalitolerans]